MTLFDCRISDASLLKDTEFSLMSLLKLFEYISDICKYFSRIFSILFIENSKT